MQGEKPGPLRAEERERASFRHRVLASSSLNTKKTPPSSLERESQIAARAAKRKPGAVERMSSPAGQSFVKLRAAGQVSGKSMRGLIACLKLNPRLIHLNTIVRYSKYGSISLVWRSHEVDVSSRCFEVKASPAGASLAGRGFLQAAVSQGSPVTVRRVPELGKCGTEWHELRMRRH